MTWEELVADMPKGDDFSPEQQAAWDAHMDEIRAERDRELAKNLAVNPMRSIPEEIRRRWPDILKACGDIDGWFGDYTGGLRLGGDDSSDDGIPAEPPSEINGYWVSDRDIGGAHYQFGTWCVFRATRAEHDQLNEGYEDSAGTENERFIDDGDHVIVVYML